MICPECGSQNIVEAVTDWWARSLEPHDPDNTGILIECQCADCSRAFWIGDDARNGFPRDRAIADLAALRAELDADEMLDDRHETAARIKAALDVLAPTLAQT